MISRPQPRAALEPPRAGASRGIWNAWFALLRRIRINSGASVRFTGLPRLKLEHMAVVLLPGYGWIPLERPLVAFVSAALYGVAALAALIWIGLTAAGLAAGLMIAIHAAGIAQYFYSGRRSPAVRHRTARSVMVLVLVAIVYGVFIRGVVNRVVIPVQTSRGVLLVNSWKGARGIVPGDIVGFYSDSWRVGNVMAAGGLHFGRVVALGGESIVFHADRVTINDTDQARVATMPTTGSVLVPDGHVFIWPLEMRERFQYESNRLDFARGFALQPFKNVAGRAYAWWFWRSTGR